MGGGVGGRRARPLIGFLALLLVAAACGSRWDSDQRAEMTERYRAADARSARSTVDTVAGTDGAGTGDTVAPSPSGSGHSGTPAASGGDGATAAPSASGSRPCAAPSTAPGVTDKEI